GQPNAAFGYGGGVATDRSDRDFRGGFASVQPWPLHETLSKHRGVIIRTNSRYRPTGWSLVECRAPNANGIGVVVRWRLRGSDFTPAVLCDCPSKLHHEVVLPLHAATL